VKNGSRIVNQGQAVRKFCVCELQEYFKSIKKSVTYITKVFPPISQHMDAALAQNEQLDEHVAKNQIPSRERWLTYR